MRVSAKVDCALRAMTELAAAAPSLMTGEQLATAQKIPPKFLESILAQLRNGGLVASQRGAEGGYWLAPSRSRSSASSSSARTRGSSSWTAAASG